MLKHFRVLCVLVEKNEDLYFPLFHQKSEKKFLQTNCYCHSDMQVQHSPPRQEGQSFLKTKMTKLKKKITKLKKNCSKNVGKSFMNAVTLMKETNIYYYNWFQSKHWKC